MTIARVSAHDGTGTTSATFGGTPTAGNLLLAACAGFGASTTLAGWTLITNGTNGFTYALSLFAKISAGNEGTVTPGTAATTMVCEYSGAAATLTQDGTAGFTGTTGATTLNSANISTTKTGSLIFLVCAREVASTFSWATATKILAGNTLQCAGEYLPGTTVTTFHDTCTFGASNDAVMAIAGFQPAASAAAYAPPSSYRSRVAVHRASSY